MANKEQGLINQVRHFVLDMDGTFYLGNRILPNSLAFLDAVTKSGRDYLFFTNNSSTSPEAYIKKLAKMDCHITPRQIMTSADVTIEYLTHHEKGKKVYLLAVPEVMKSFAEAGVELSDTEADIVLVAFDKTLDYQKLVKACDFIRSGARFFATHPDINCPVEGGFIPDVGSFIALISASCGGVKPYILGKPYAATLDMIVEETGWKKEEIAFVGDRIYTDVATGVNNGAKGILVLSGEADWETVRTSSITPDGIFDDLGAMIPYL